MSEQREYTNGEITVVWNPEICVHSGNCVRGLGKVFKPRERPWVQIGNATSDEIRNTIDTCPSGALTYKE